MEQSFWVFEVIATFIESLIALSVVSVSSEQKYSRRRNLILHLAFSAILTLIITILNFISIFSYITPLIAIAFIVFISSRVLSKGPWMIRMTACFLAYTVIQTMDYIIVVIMGLIKNDPTGFFVSITTQGKERLLFLILNKAIEILLFFLLQKQLPKLLSLSRKKQGAALVLSVVSYSYMQFLFSSVLSPLQSVVQTTVIFSWVFILLFILAMLGFFVALTRIEKEEQIKGLLSSENAMMLENYSMLNKQQQTYAKQLHDFKHHLAAIEGLLSQKKISEAEQYIKTLYEHSSQTAILCHSGNDIIDAIINCKSAEADSLGIIFSFSANVQDGVNIESVDICGVLANQIDNAMEACKMMPEGSIPCISVEVKLAQDFLVLMVNNTVAQDPFDAQGQLVSKKKSASSLHGLGLKSISEIANRYNGSVINEYKDGHFISSVTLCQKPFDTEKTTK